MDFTVRIALSVTGGALKNVPEGCFLCIFWWLVSKTGSGGEEELDVNRQSKDKPNP